MDPLLSSRLHRSMARALLVGMLCADMSIAQAWTLNLAAASRRVFLQVGNGNFNANNSVVNRVSVDVPFNQLGTGVAQQMSSNSTLAGSPVDGFGVCAPPVQVYVGGSYQRSSATNGPATALLQVSSPATLTSAGGETIPFTQISWTVSTVGTGDATPNVIPAGTFTGGPQNLTTIAANQYIENCHTFSYANTTLRPAGTYDGRVTYTLSTP